MQRTTWILQDFIRAPSPSIPALEHAIIEAEYPLVKAPVVAFSDAMPDIPDEIEPPIVIYGMNTMIRNTLRHPKWKLGLFFDPARFETSSYTRILSDRMLNADAQLMTCEELAESGLAPGDRFFLRPNDDTKSFTGQLLDFREYMQWYGRKGDPDYVDLSPEMLVVYAEPKTIHAEYRTFLLNRKVITSSQYIPEQRQFTPPEVIEFAEHIAGHYEPSDAFVCDIAGTPEGLKVIEFNCINGCGFYQANIGAIVRALSSWQEANVE